MSRPCLNTLCSKLSSIHVYLVSSHYRFAASQGVHWYTFDSEYEIEKMAKFDPSAELLVRLKVGNPHSVVFQVNHYGVLLTHKCGLKKRFKLPYYCLCTYSLIISLECL